MEEIRITVYKICNGDTFRTAELAIIAENKLLKNDDSEYIITEDGFPTWNPNRQSRLVIFGDDSWPAEAYGRLRRSSSGFIARKDVRKHLFDKYNHECNNCGSKEQLQIDHIMSVYSCFHNGFKKYCNTEKNLQVLCSQCNRSKGY